MLSGRIKNEGWRTHTTNTKERNKGSEAWTFKVEGWEQRHKKGGSFANEGQVDYTKKTVAQPHPNLETFLLTFDGYIDASKPQGKRTSTPKGDS